MTDLLYRLREHAYALNWQVAAGLATHYVPRPRDLRALAATARADLAEFVEARGWDLADAVDELNHRLSDARIRAGRHRETVLGMAGSPDAFYLRPRGRNVPHLSRELCGGHSCEADPDVVHYCAGA